MSSFSRQIAVALVVFVFSAAVILVVKHVKREPVSMTGVPSSQESGRDLLQQETVVERDVEVNYLEPLLVRLGFMREDWIRQLPVRVGRGEKAFPDYALLVKGEGDGVTAEYVWEAKYTIPSVSQLETDFYQARSYALLVRAKALGLVSKEGVWFAKASPDFDLVSLKHYTWEDLKVEKNLEAVKSVFTRKYHGND